MPNLATATKEEIRGLARREMKAGGVYDNEP